jgi:reactive intermediate/imine deaminase
MNDRLVNARSVHPTTGYSHAVKVGNTVYVAGQVAKDKDGNLVGKGDIHAQAEQVFANLKAVLADAGCTMNDIVKLTTYTTNLAFRPAIAEARKRYFSDYFPPNTFVVISSLAEPDFLLEIEAIAVAR